MSNKDKNQVSVILGRGLLAISLTTYIPTLMLIIISHVTNFFKPSYFEAAVTVNLTTLLVLATLYITVNIICLLL